MNQARSFIFISTLEHIPWGGCEDLWFKTALLALEEKQKVLVVVFQHDKIPSHLQTLSEKGATLFFLERNVKASIAKRIENKIAPGKQHKEVFKKLSKEIDENKNVKILVSQAGGFDFVYPYLDDVRLWLLQNKTYHVVVQNVPDLGFTLSLDKAIRQDQLFSAAKSVGFVSKRNHVSAERILASDISNGFVINNPLNFEIVPDYISFTSMEPFVEFAVVAALRCFHKGQDILFQVLSGKEWQERNWELNLYGTGPDENYLKKLAAYYQLEERIFFHGHVNDIKEVWQNNHIHILPSLGEGTPLSLIESMICGRPGITTDVGGNAEYAIHLENAFIADYPTYPALKKVMELAWENKESWEELGKKARKKIEESYDLHAVENLYQRLKG